MSDSGIQKQTVSRRNGVIDATEGPLLKKILRFSFPIMATSILQMLYNTADSIVVGNSAGHTALAAVTSCGSTISLFNAINLGMASGASILISRAFGAKKEKQMSDTLHTSVLVGIISGLLLLVAGFLLARPTLALLHTPDDVIDEASLYLKIYLCGAPFNVLYLFCSHALIAIGDSKKPLLYSSLSGIANVILNCILDFGFQMGVVGVALGTVLSQILSCIQILLYLFKGKGILKLSLRKIRFRKTIFFNMLSYGIPQACSTAMYAVSNMLIQSSLNDFGSITIAANGAAQQIEHIPTYMMTAFISAISTFTAQNVGAGKLSRVWKVIGIASALAIGTALVFGPAAYFFGQNLLPIFTNETDPGFLAAYIADGKTKLFFCGGLLFLQGCMDIFPKASHGMGHPILPTFVGVTITIGVRLLWVFFVLPANNTYAMLLTVYPVTWTLAAIVQFLIFLILYRKEKQIRIQKNNAPA